MTKHIKLNIPSDSPLRIVPNDSPDVPHHPTIKFTGTSNFSESTYAPPFGFLTADDSYLDHSYMLRNDDIVGTIWARSNEAHHLKMEIIHFH